MQITKAGEYGVLGLIALSRRPLGEVVMIDVLCEEESVPKSFLGKIFQNLSKSGLVGSARGSGGGFYLTRPAAEITVLEILESIEGPIALQRCLEIDVGCEHSRGCALCGLLAEAQERMKEVFAGTSLATLAGRHLPNGLVQQARQGRNSRIPLTASEVSQDFVTDDSEPEDPESRPLDSSVAKNPADSPSLN